MARYLYEQKDQIIRGLRETTGRTLDEWVGLLVTSELVRPTERITWLMREHKLPHGVATVIVSETARIRDYQPPEPMQMIAAQYAGPRAGLRPLFDSLAGLLARLGQDVIFEPTPRQVMVLRRRDLFASVQPANVSWVELALVLPGAQARGRLVPARKEHHGARMTHFICVGSTDDIDQWLAECIASAYERAGGPKPGPLPLR